MMKLILVTIILLKHALGHGNISQSADNNPRTDQPSERIWIANSIISVNGFILNIFVLSIFYRERKQLVTSVNAMIM